MVILHLRFCHLVILHLRFCHPHQFFTLDLSGICRLLGGQMTRMDTMCLQLERTLHQNVCFCSSIIICDFCDVHVAYLDGLPLDKSCNVGC
jgi:hypothetical protein